MNEPDETGWSHIHHCAFRGYIKSLERFVENDPDSLELQTQDDLSSTPFLLAVTSGIQETVEFLLEKMGAKVDAINSQNHGAVEICAIKQYVTLLRYFLSQQLEKLPVWKNLLKMLGSDMEEEVAAAGTCLRTLTDPSDEGINPDWEAFYNAGGVPVISKVVKATYADECKVPALQLLLNIVERPEVQEQFVSSGGLPALIKLLKTSDNFVVQLAATIIRELVIRKEYAELAMQNNLVPGLQRVLQAVHDWEVLVPTVQALGNLAAAGSKMRSTVGTTPGCIGAVVGLFDIASEADLMLALTEAVGKIATDSRENQNALVNEGVTQHIVNVILNQSRNRKIQESAVEAIHRMAENNGHVQHDILERGAERLLMQLLKKRSAESLQEKTAMALWALAGDDINEKREMANGIGVQTLIEFVNTLSPNLHLIGSEGLGVLAQGPLNQQSQIAQANGIYPLVRLLRAPTEDIVLSVIRSLRYLCVGVGNVPHSKNQTTISTSRGIKLLIALMVHSLSERIQVEAAFTLGCVSLGNNEVLEEIHGFLDFSYVRILKMMYARDEEVRLLAGSALSAFAYNNIQQQREIADQGGVRFNCFVPYLRSDKEMHRCSAAYQVVVLARIIPDEEQAKSSAVGIKLLVDILHESISDDVKSLAAGYIACLAHTRAGVPSAIVAINAVDYLCNMLTNQAEHVRGNAAIALSYLSYNHAGERHLLNRCRMDPYLMRVIKHYTKRHKLAPSFVEGWQHYKKVGLPPIPEGRPSLVRARAPREDIRPITILSLEDTPSGSQVRGSASNLNLGEENGRSSRASRASHGSRHTNLTMQASQLSLDTQRTQTSMPEIMVEES